MLRLSIGLAFLILCFVTIAESQTITINNNLLFGNMLPGQPKQIDKTSASSAAEFHVAGTAGSEISIDFTLPTYMWKTGATMQLIFRKTDCALDSAATPNQSSPPVDNLDPWHTITYRLGSAGLTLWLGGTAVPGIVQNSGSYTSDIVLTVAYTGL